MKTLVAVTSCPTGIAHTQMAAEALKKAAAVLGHRLRVETQGAAGTGTPLTESEIAAANVVILATDVRVDSERFAGKPVHATSTSEAIRHTQRVIEAALALLPPEVVSAPAAAIPASAPTSGGRKLVGITACPTGIAHTFMAAEALQKAAKALGHSIRVETQGSVGAKSALTAEEIAAADAVVIAADTKVDLSRFTGKRLLSIGTKQAMKAGQEAIQAAFEAPIAGADSAAVNATAARKERTGPYKHLMTGVSYMLPVVIAGGLAIALAFAFGGIYAGDQKGTLAAALSLIGGGTAFKLFIAVLSGFIAYSIADRPGLAPGLIGGMLAQTLGAGFLGGLAAGFLAGYLTKFLAERIKLPATMQGLMPVLVLPFLSTLGVGLLMIYVIAPPVEAINTALETWLNNMRGTNAFLLGMLLGAMMAFDMGGPVNKAAYTFAVGLLASKVYGPMAAVIAGGMTPPLGLALAAWVFRSRFDLDERQAAGPAFVLGLSFITEGAIPFAAKDPLRVIPATVLGSAVAGGLSMLAGAQLLVPHGGVFAALIPGAVTQLLPYLGALAAGTLVTTAALFVLKRPLAPLAATAA